MNSLANLKIDFLKIEISLKIDLRKTLNKYWIQKWCPKILVLKNSVWEINHLTSVRLISNFKKIKSSSFPDSDFVIRIQGRRMMLKSLRPLSLITCSISCARSSYKFPGIEQRIDKVGKWKNWKPTWILFGNTFIMALGKILVEFQEPIKSLDFHQYYCS